MLNDYSHGSKFKTPTGQRHLKALFFEMNNTNVETAIYTLKHNDHSYNGRDYVSLYRKYLEMEDLTEFEFANTYFEDFSHWEMVCKCNWFTEHVDQWRKELHLKLSAKALRRIKAEAQTNGLQAIACNKYLLEKGWLPKDKTRGRPSKQELANTKQQIILAEKELNDDFLRISTSNGLVN